ncbi:MAG: hypothetical protein ACYTBJ_01830 [Planctomycetota bacterium]|jgi:hypothetical protein
MSIVDRVAERMRKAGKIRCYIIAKMEGSFYHGPRARFVRPDGTSYYAGEGANVACDKGPFFD